METKMTFDAVTFLRETLKDMRGDVDHAYPKPLSRFCPANGHAALQMVSSKIEVLNNFLDAIEQKPVVPERPRPFIDERIGG